MASITYPMTEAAWQKQLRSFHRRIQTEWNRENWSKVVSLCAEFKIMCRNNHAAGGLGEPDNWPWYKNMFEDAQQKNGLHWQRIVQWDDIA